jgi:DnaJ-class molecular chaperone
MSHYEILGCHPASSPDEIKRAYYQAARKYHPDKNSGQDEDFKKIAQAYAILSDPNKKSQYDLTLPQVKVQMMEITPETFITGGDCRFQFSEDVWLDQNGELAHPVACPRCRRGTTFSFFCSLCQGSRQVYPTFSIKAQRERLLQVQVPPRSWPGRLIYVGRQPISLQMGSSRGPLSYNNGILYYTERVHVFQALLGLDKEIVIAGERHHLLHPDPILPTSEVVIPDAGIYRPTGERGPLSIIFEIEFPKELQPNQRRLLTECLENSEKEVPLSQ